MANKKTAAKKTAPKKAVPKKTVSKAAPLKTSGKAAFKTGGARKKAPVVSGKKPVKPAAKKTAPKKAAPKKTVSKAAPGRGKTPAASSAESRELRLKRLLIQKREDIIKEAQTEIAKYIKGENRQLVETALDDGDWSVIDLSEDINLMKLDTHRRTLQKIDEALRKLREGTYGTCEECGDEINSERLRILPFAIYCRDCQEKKEELEASEREYGH